MRIKGIHACESTLRTLSVRRQWYGIIFKSKNTNDFFKNYIAEGKQKAADFEDLLSSQGFNAHKDKKGPRTIAEMRKEEMAKEMDPEKLKVSESLTQCILYDKVMGVEPSHS